MTNKPKPIDYSKLDFTEPIAQAVAKVTQFKPAESAAAAEQWGATEK